LHVNALFSVTRHQNHELSMPACSVYLIECYLNFKLVIWLGLSLIRWPKPFSHPLFNVDLVAFECLFLSHQASE